MFSRGFYTYITESTLVREIGDYALVVTCHCFIPKMSNYYGKGDPLEHVLNYYGETDEGWFEQLKTYSICSHEQLGQTKDKATHGDTHQC